MSRAHVQGFDSNAEQFARMGNPWVTEAERHEFAGSAKNNRERRALMKNGKFPKPEVPAVERKPERSSRSESEHFAQIVRSRKFMAAFKSALPGGTRTVAPARPEPTPYLNRVGPAANTELTGCQRVLRDVQRAEVEERCASIAREDERARLKAIIAAAEARLRSL